MLTSGLCVGHFQSKIQVLYKKLNSLAARNTNPIKTIESFKTRKNLIHSIKKLGSQSIDGQFVLGLRDGHGAAISSLEMFSLTMATLGNTIMLMDVINHSNAVFKILFNNV